MSDHLMVDFRKWAKQSPEHMFNAWRQRLQKKVPDMPVKKPKSKVIIHFSKLLHLHPKVNMNII